MGKNIKAPPRDSSCFSRNNRGQLLIPSLLCMATFFLFVILIFEIGRLSRAKISQQFALDAAASLEMEQYTDLLNRLAYLNGVFPDRVFRELYTDKKMWSEKYFGGLFAADPKGVSPEDPVWRIRFGPHRDELNVADPPPEFPQLHMNPNGQEAALSLEDAQVEQVLYTKVYKYLGDIAGAQKAVFESVVLDRHLLLRKSLWLNLQAEEEGMGACSEDVNSCGNEAATAFRRILIRRHALGITLPPLRHCPVRPPIGVDDGYVGAMEGAFRGTSDIWQLMTVPTSDLNMLRRGFIVTNHWAPRRNFFNVNLNEYLPGSEDPFVQVTVKTSGGQVWPDSTPKYSTRLSP